MTAGRPARLSLVEGLPLHRQLGVTTIDASDGRASLSVPVGDAVCNPAGVLHGGVLYLLCDVVSYAAALTTLADDEEAVTHAIHVSVLRPVARGARLELEGEVHKRGRTLAFLGAVARADGRVVARAEITKSILGPGR